MTNKKIDRLHPLDGGKTATNYTQHPAPKTDRSFRPTAPRTVRGGKSVNPDKKGEAVSLLATADFSEIEKRIAAWEGWHEGPMVQNESIQRHGTITGRWCSSGPEPQYLARTPEAGVASDPVVNQTEETK